MMGFPDGTDRQAAGSVEPQLEKKRSEVEIKNAGLHMKVIVRLRRVD